MTDLARPAGALPLAGGWCWFSHVELIERGRPPQLRPAADLPPEMRDILTEPRPALAGLALGRPRVMGILNITPDSFSDGGRFLAPEAAMAQARRLLAEGADLLDVGGESTRPGARPIPPDQEIARTAPIIEALRQGGMEAPISIDTRKATVAAAAFAAGADILNDVSALGFDPALAKLAAARAVPVCLMHAQGSPETMQDAPHYDDVVIDVFQALAAHVARAEAAGIDRARILIDPGIGFGKTLAHNLALIRRLSVLHGLGCPIVFGASRKRFIAGIDPSAALADDRLGGSIAAALAAAGQGAQMIRVHDVAQTRQALAIAQALSRQETPA
jgi:dihydropteroate synthase